MANDILMTEEIMIDDVAPSKDIYISESEEFIDDSYIEADDGFKTSNTLILGIVIGVCAIIGIVLGIILGRRAARK